MSHGQLDRADLRPTSGVPLGFGTLADLRAEAARWAYSYVFLLGLVVTATVHVLPGDIGPRALALILLATPVCAWAVHSRSCVLGVWTAVAGSFVAIILAQQTYPSSMPLMALGILAGLIAALVGKWAGLASAVVCTLLLAALSHGNLLDTAIRAVPMAIVLIWGVVLLVWISTEPLTAFVRWSWYYYTWAREYAHQAGDRQVELKQALKDLQEANRQLEYLNRIVQGARIEAEEAHRTKVEFVANVSHELRTPLNMIIGFSETIQEASTIYRVDMPPAMMADIDAIYRNACHLQELIDDVLDLSQIDMHRMALTKEPTDVRDLIAEATEAVRYLYESKNLSLEVRLPPRLPVVLCDRTRIREVMLNVLSNAGRFTEEGGVTVTGTVQQARLTISVSDTGPGIPEEKLKSVFQPFQQLDSGIRRRYGGSGLGLAISRAFVEMHEGRMWIESQVGRGTTVHFDLPLPPAATSDSVASEVVGRYAELRVRPLRPPTVPPRPRLGVIDGDRVVQRLLVRYMPEIEAVSIDSLAEAARQHAEHPFLAIVANADRPEQLLQYLQQQPSLPAQTPLMVTSFARASQSRHILDVEGYLVKPVTRQKLLEALDSLSEPIRTVLVADDDFDVPQLFDRMLSVGQRGRYRILQASNGHETLHLLRSRRPDVLLLDLIMPGMDGYQVLKEKNSDPAIRDIPVFIISARDLLEQPLASAGMMVMRRRGLTVPEVLETIRELTRIVALLPLSGDPKPSRTPRG